VTDGWNSNWIEGDFEIVVDPDADEMVYKVGPASSPSVELKAGLIVLSSDRHFRVEGRHHRKRIVGDAGVAASVVDQGRMAALTEMMISAGINLGGTSLSIETGGLTFRLDRIDESRPKLEVFVKKLATIQVKGVMTDMSGAEVLHIGKLYRKERIGFTSWPVGRRMAGRFEGYVRAIRPVPTPAALLALHLVLRPETLLRTGVWEESGNTG
jgi:hypothetical protein